VLDVLSSLAIGVGGQELAEMLIIEELAREANLGPKGSRVNISVDQCIYRLPGKDKEAEEVVFEIESHGVDNDVILAAGDWVLSQAEGRIARQPKYARGLRKLGEL
jgi:hypothetical protein